MHVDIPDRDVGNACLGVVSAEASDADSMAGAAVYTVYVDV